MYNLDAGSYTMSKGLKWDLCVHFQNLLSFIGVADYLRVPLEGTQMIWTDQCIDLSVTLCGKYISAYNSS